MYYVHLSVNDSGECPLSYAPSCSAFVQGAFHQRLVSDSFALDVIVCQRSLWLTPGLFLPWEEGNIVIKSVLVLPDLACFFIQFFNKHSFCPNPRMRIQCLNVRHCFRHLSPPWSCSWSIESTVEPRYNRKLNGFVINKAYLIFGLTNIWNNEPHFVFRLTNLISFSD